jgi:hypothetical protein
MGKTYKYEWAGLAAFAMGRGWFRTAPSLWENTQPFRYKDLPVNVQENSRYSLREPDQRHTDGE